jgi:hypothetical protein
MELLLRDLSEILNVKIREIKHLKGYVTYYELMPIAVKLILITEYMNSIVKNPSLYNNSSNYDRESKLIIQAEKLRSLTELFILKYNQAFNDLIQQLQNKV